MILRGSLELLTPVLFWRFGERPAQRPLREQAHTPETMVGTQEAF